MSKQEQEVPNGRKPTESTLFQESLKTSPPGIMAANLSIFSVTVTRLFLLPKWGLSGSVQKATTELQLYERYDGIGIRCSLPNNHIYIVHSRKQWKVSNQVTAIMKTYTHGYLSGVAQKPDLLRRSWSYPTLQVWSKRKWLFILLQRPGDSRYVKPTRQDRMLMFRWRDVVCSLSMTKHEHKCWGLIVKNKKGRCWQGPRSDERVWPREKREK